MNENTMPDIIEINTERLLLRQWRSDDWPHLARMNADPRVMEFYPRLLTKEESNNMAQRIQSLIAKQGWGLWAVEEKATRNFTGFVGLHEPVAKLPCSPCVEIGWRLDCRFWGKGYATEAGNASLEFAFVQLGEEKIYSFASIQNTRSQAVMKRLHMHNTGNNFEHPDIPTDSPLRKHVLYEISKTDWQKAHNL